MKKVKTITPIPKKIKIKKDKKKVPKFGGSYMTLYGSETIRKSIEENRKILDYICVIHQTETLFGTSCLDEQKMFEELNKLKSEKLIDDIIVCNKYADETVTQFIIRKRNIGLNLCKVNSCDYIVPLDADEIYLKESKDFVLNNDFDTYYTSIKTYYCDPSAFFIDNYYVPFCYKVNSRTFYEKYDNSLIVDPLRSMKEDRFVLIPDQYMHHYSVTKNLIEIKMANNIGKLSNTLVMDMWNYMLAFIECEFDGSEAIVFDHAMQQKRIPLTKDVNSPWR